MDETHPARGHRQLDHTADLALEIWAPTESELLVEGARALLEVLIEGVSLDVPSDPASTRTVELQALDREDRLVRWLNEILVLAVNEGFLCVEADITLEGEASLSACLRGHAEAHEAVTTELKSVTYHDLYLAREGSRWRATVVVDV
jgi:SHS2 domain-containing protein